MRTNKALLLALLVTAASMPALAQGVKEQRGISSSGPIDLIPAYDSKATENKAALDTPPADVQSKPVEQPVPAPVKSAPAAKPAPVKTETLPAAQVIGDRDEEDHATETVVVPKDADISVSTVSHISLDTLGVYDASKGGVAMDVWKGSSHDRVKDLLNALPESIPSESVRQQVSRLLLSATTPPVSENIQQNILHERVNALITLGQADQAARLLEMIPKDQRNDAVQRDLFAVHMLQGDDAWVCDNITDALSKNDSASNGDNLWQTYSIFCMAKDGKAAETQLALDVLREQQRELGGAMEEVFLVKSGNVSKLTAKLPEPVSMLHAAMAIRLGQAAFSGEYVKTAPLPIAQMIAISSEMPAGYQELASHRIQELDSDDKANAEADQNTSWLRKHWAQAGGTIDSEKLAADLERKTTSEGDDDASRKLRRYRLYAVAEALGQKMAGDVAPWKQGAAEVKQRVVSPALRMALKDAIASGKKGEALLLIAMIIGQVGDLAEMQDGTLAELIHALRDIGMEETADAFAAEAVIALF